MTQNDNPFEQSFRKGSKKENRVHVRIPCSESTHFSSARRLFEGTIKNASTGGVFIQTKGRFNVGQEVVVAGVFDEDENEVKRYGRVVRAEPNGIAVQFVRKDAAIRR